ncbi:hypothetical protein ABIA45_007078 [Bradyrhizobium sp. USDA 336]
MNEPVSLATGMRVLPLDRRTVGVVGGEHLRCHVLRATAEVVDVEGVKELYQWTFLKRRQPQSAHPVQQILGNCSPHSQSTRRRPPKQVVICTNL